MARSGAASWATTTGARRRDAEVARMRALLREEMAAGALGLSTGLEYDPGIFSAPSEVLSSRKSPARSAAATSATCAARTASSGRRSTSCSRIGREARIPVQVSHIKLAMRGLWGQARQLVATLDRARRGGHRRYRRRLSVDDVAVDADGAVPEAQLRRSRRDRVHPEGSRFARRPRDRHASVRILPMPARPCARSPRCAAPIRQRR